MGKTDNQAFGEKFQQQLAKNGHLSRALDYFQEKEYATAKIFLEMVIKEDPTADVYHLLAMVEQGEGELEQAMVWLNSALEIAPKSADLYNTLGDILVKRKRYHDAIDAFEKALKLQPNHSDARYNLGTSLMSLKEYKEAEIYLRQVLEKQPNHYHEINRVFLFFGGADPDDLTSTALQVLSQPKLKHLLVDVVIGSSNPHQAKLQNQIKKHIF